ncbi:MFS transporter [Bacillus sp. 31A1R]|uniref:MFS transporter n=1 Tax=Robertmurraya mangrovi TaxID=3098077 RepID=A0ABU5ISY0_9BACI|nr:MFS transporter [Bacillus sp. 31A1R]MDZ5470258.1 MFS transporter [Bacillus sp. 31A1R]
MISKWVLTLTSVILTITGIFVASNIYTLIPIYEVVATDFQMKDSQIVIASTLFSFFYASGLLFFGPASDRFGRKRTIVFGLLASSISTLAVGLSNELISLFISRSIQGFTLGSFAPVAFAYSFDLFSPKKRTLLLVFINTGFLVAGILGQLISSTFTMFISWNFVYYFFAFIYFILFVLSMFFLPITKPPEVQNQRIFNIFRRLLKNKNLIKCYGITFTLLFSFVALYDSIGRFYNGTVEEIFTLRAVGLIGAILSLFTGRLIDRYGIGKTMFTGFTLSASSLLGMYLFNNLIGLIIFSVFFVASISLLLPTVITLVGTLGGQHRAKALSLYSFILLTGASIAPLVVVFLGFHQVMLLLLAMFLFNLISGYTLLGSIRNSQ